MTKNNSIGYVINGLSFLDYNDAVRHCHTFGISTDQILYEFAQDLTVPVETNTQLYNIAKDMARQDTTLAFEDMYIQAFMNGFKYARQILQAVEK